MANTSDIRNGMCMEFNNDIWVIVEFQHVKPGKGAAFVRTKLKSLTKGKVVDNTFSAGHKIDEVRVERRHFQFLYKDDMGYNFMNLENYDQITLEESLIENPKFLKPEMNVEVLYHAEKDVPLNMEMPVLAEYEIVYTEPGMKGDTATNTFKNATIENDVEIRVPLFINTGDVVKLNPRTGEYQGRV